MLWDNGLIEQVMPSEFAESHCSLTAGVRAAMAAIITLADAVG